MEIIYESFFLGNHHATALFLGNSKPEDVATLEIEDPFTKELVEAWCLLNFNILQYHSVVTAVLNAKKNFVSPNLKH